jgi:serine/threonine protein kinase
MRHVCPGGDGGGGGVVTIVMQEFAYYAPEVMNSPGVTTHKGNVWSFGVVLLELLTGRKNMDERVTRENRDLVGWARPFLKEQGRLFLVIDSKLRGQFPTRGAKLIADVVLACLHPDPARRPTMKMVVEMMKSSMTHRYSRNFTGLDQQQTTDPVNDFSGLELHRLPYTDNGMMMIGRSELVPSPPPLPRWCASENLSRHCHCPHGYATSAPLERI